MKNVILTIFGIFGVVVLIGNILSGRPASTAESLARTSSPTPQAVTPVMPPVMPPTADPTAAPTRQATKATMSSWGTKMLPALSAMQEDMVAAGKAGEITDMAGMLRACRSMKRNTNRVRTHLPSPDAVMNFQMGSALDDFNEAADHCISGLEDRNPSKLQEAAGHMQSGTRRLTAATALIEGYR